MSSRLDSRLQAKLQAAINHHNAGDLAEAERLYRQVLRHNTVHNLINKQLGKLYFQKEAFSQAETHLARALLSDGFDADTTSLLAFVCAKQGDINKTQEYVSKTLHLNPDPEKEYLVRVLQHKVHLASGRVRDHRGVADNLMALNRLQPGNIEFIDLLIGALELMGETESARAVIDNARRARPDLGDSWDLRDALMFPPVMQSREQIAADRSRCEDMIDRMLSREINLNWAVRAQTFFFAYHGLNNTALLGKIGTLLSRLASLRFVAPHVDAPPPGGRYRIGFISANFISGHPVAKAANELILRLSERAEIEIHIIALQPANQKIGLDLAGRNVRLTVIGETFIDNIRKRVASLELDVLLYSDIGMDPLTCFLAHARLARAQCVMGGHPETTGIPNMDYFISHAFMEPEGAQAHYTERLILLRKGMFPITRPLWQESIKRREDFGFSKSDRLYFCPMMLQKIHPEFDRIIREILDKDPLAHVIFPQDGDLGVHWRRLLEARQASVFTAEQRARIGFVPWQDNLGDFVALLRSVDVVLDSIHFGCGTTALVAIAAGVPIVTLPCEFMRGRVAASFFQHLGVCESVAESVDDYIAKAVEFAGNPAWRNDIGRRLLEQSDRLFDPRHGAAVVDEFVDTLMAIGAAGRTH